MGMDKQEIIDGIKADIDEIGQHLKDWDKVREMAGVERCEEDSAQGKLVELLLVVAGHQESWGHEHVKAAAKQWLEENVSGLGEFYADGDDDDYEVAEHKAVEFGKEKGKAAAQACFDGNTPTEQYAAVLKGHEDGDPVVMEMEPSPLSGEWADGLTANDVYAAASHNMIFNIDQDLADVLIEAFTAAFSEAFWDEVVRICRYHLEDDAVNRNTERTLTKVEPMTIKGYND